MSLDKSHEEYSEEEDRWYGVCRILQSLGKPFHVGQETEL